MKSAKKMFNNLNTSEFSSSVCFLLKQGNRENTKQVTSLEITPFISIKPLSKSVLVFLSLLKSWQGELLIPFYLREIETARQFITQLTPIHCVLPRGLSPGLAK